MVATTSAVSMSHHSHAGYEKRYARGAVSGDMVVTDQSPRSERIKSYEPHAYLADNPDLAELRNHTNPQPNLISIVFCQLSRSSNWQQM